VIRIGFGVGATPAERAAVRPGDTLVSPADVVMDRAFTVPAPPEAVWPWLAQLGKRRAGWYLPRAAELLLPRERRALRVLRRRWIAPKVGQVLPDYGGRAATFEVVQVDPPRALVYATTRGATEASWSITLLPAGSATRVVLRLRLAPVRHRRLAVVLGGLIDLLSVAGMATGLRERVGDQQYPVQQV
jgi:hypothetical protein